MAPPLTIVCFLWRRNPSGFQLPAVIDYGPEHVRRLERGLKRHMRTPFRFVCITDQPESLEGIETIPLWDKCSGLGGCYNRLYTFSPDMRQLIGERFVCIDIDCIVMGDLTPLFSRPESFVINRYIPSPAGDCAKDQDYNGGLYMMDAGARADVWDHFNPVISPMLVDAAKDQGKVVGTDQAWIRLVLGSGEATFGPEHGVYEARMIGRELPADAKLVFFAGRRDPSRCGYKWARENWL